MNHAWSGGGLTVLSEYLCGIAPLSPGYETISILPRPGKIHQAMANISSIKGNISCSFVQSIHDLDMKIQTPSGIPTIVGVPDNRVYEIWVNGQLVWKRENI